MVLPPSPSREDVDDSWERFLRDRRKSKEKERLRLFELKRNAALKEQRRVARLQEPAVGIS